MATPNAPPILALMVASIVLLGGVALWDEQRESTAALDDFGAAQASLAAEAGAALSARLEAAGGGEVTTAALLALAVRRIVSPGTVVALFQKPGETALITPAGDVVRSPPLADAALRGASWVRLTRDESPALGLPGRMSIAGIASAEGPRGAWKVAIVATAQKVRDRQIRAVRRLVLGISLASAFIAGFGMLARRKQQREIDLARGLARAEAREEQDERLVRADKLATLGALATGIAHEVSTPLGVIVGRAEQLLPKMEGDPRAARSVRVITEQAERIGGIVRAFLRLARGAAPSLEQVDPGALAVAAADLVEHRMTRAHVTLTRDIAEGLPRVACDRRLFEQVLVNLLLNACDACREGGHVELSVRAEGERVVFVVADDGEGITPEVARRATEPFFTTKSESDGTGLGLAIASEIVKHHHGSLTLAPRGGTRGTRAVVELGAVSEAHVR